MVPRLQLFGLRVQCINFYTDRKKKLFSPIWASIKLLCVQCVFFFKNISDVSIIAETLSLCSGEVQAMIKGMVYILNRGRVQALLVDLQKNVDRSKPTHLNFSIFYNRKHILEELLGRTKHYVAMNKQATFWSRIMIATMTNSIFSICLGPILAVLYHYITGDLTSDMYRQPVGLE